MYVRMDRNAADRVEYVCDLTGLYANGHWDLQAETPAVYIGLNLMSLCTLFLNNVHEVSGLKSAHLLCEVKIRLCSNK